MARQRMIRPELWESERVDKLTDFEFRIYVGLISHADDEGRLSASPVLLASKIFPLSATMAQAEAIKEAIERMESIRDDEDNSPMIGVYQSGKKVYLFHPHWHKHQIVHKSHRAVSKMPAPPRSKDYDKRRKLVISYGYKLRDA